MLEADGGAAVARVPDRPGWLVCAAALLITCGVNSAVHGFTALHDQSFFGPDVVYDHLTFWGWFFIAWGAAEAVAGVLVLGRRRGAMMAATALAGIGMMTWFCMIFAAPESALIGIAVNGLIVWSLAVAGGLGRDG